MGEIFMENISVLSKEKCFGCGACVSNCPVNAIKMINNDEGFFEPVIDESLCIRCGLCSKICPALNDIKVEKFSSQYFLGRSRNLYECYQSSSGGIFSLLANTVLEKNGVVCGAAFDENAKLKHVIVDKKEDLYLLRGSKYLQSYMGDVYQLIQKYLKQHRCVLFCGTPCQVAALRNFLQKEYANLILVDLVCHGVPSQKTFDEYLVEKFGKNQKYSTINFRDKRNGYSMPSFVIKDSEGHDLLVSDFKESYLQGFGADLFLRKSCGTCPFAKTERISDITLADYHSVPVSYPELDYEKGFSSFIINTSKGCDFFNLIKDKICDLKKVSLEKISQPCLEKPSAFHPNRDLYFSLKNMAFSKKIEKCLHTKSVAVLNFTDENSNYGALLVAYSMKKILQNLGYEPYNLNYIRNKNIKISEIFESFRQKHLNMTLPCFDEKDLNKIQNQFSAFVTGGDQVFNGFYPIYLLHWVKGCKNVFSYAASMGNHNWSYFSCYRKIIQKYLSNFDNIAVRERSAVEILSKLGVKSDCYIDSTIVLNSDEYDEIILSDNDIKPINKKYIACVLWHFDDIKQTQVYKDLSEKYEFVDVLNYNQGPSFGEFLNLIKNADWVITNSYHGVAFSIIFNKNFYAIRMNDMRDDRIISLFSMLGIKSTYLLTSLNELNLNAFNVFLDYSLINEKIKLEQKRAYEYFRMALTNHPFEKYADIYKVKKIKLFNKIPVAKMFIKNKKIKFVLLGIPFLTINLIKRKGYLLNKIPIFSYKEKNL